MRSPIKLLAGHLAACIACAYALAAPASAVLAGTLYGITGAGPASELRVIDTGTGTSETFMSLGLDAVGAATAAVSADGTALYVAGRLGGVPTLKTVAPFLPTLGTAALDRSFASLVVRGDGTLLGLAWNGANWELRSIAPTTGVSTLVGTVPGLVRLIPAARALTGAGELIQLGFDAVTPSVLRLYRVNATSGAFVGSAVCDYWFHSLAYDGSRLLGSGWAGSQEDLRSINPATGVSSFVRPYPAFGLLPPSANAVDLAEGVIHQVGHASSAADVPHLYTMKTAGGGTPSDVALDERFVALVHAPNGPALDVGDPGTIRHSLALAPAQPNPFRGTTRIGYSLDRAAHVRIQVLDVAGRVVRVLVDAGMPAGSHEITWAGRDANGRRVPTGIYFTRMRTGGRELRGRVVVIQ